MENRASYTVGGNVSWCSHYGKHHGGYPRKLKIEFFRSYVNRLTYDPSIPLLGIYPEETKIEKNTCIPLFIAALLIIARTWKQPAAAAAAKLLQSCLTPCDPIDGSPLGSCVPGILQARILEWVAISFSNA